MPHFTLGMWGAPLGPIAGEVIQLGFTACRLALTPAFWAPSCGLTHAHTHAYTGAYTRVHTHAHSHMNTQTTHAHSHMHAQTTHAHSQVLHVCTYMHGHTCMRKPTCTGAYIWVYTQTPLALFCSFTCFSLPHAQPTPYYPRPGSHLWLILADINKKQWWLNYTWSWK